MIGPAAHRRNSAVLVAGVAMVVAVLAARTADAATITVSYSTSVFDGFNSTDPPDPVSPAAGATLGEQRRASFEAAAADWGARLASNVTIEVDAAMVAMSCNSFSAVLGAAGPNFVEADWMPGAGGSPAPFAATWYPNALANKIANTDLTAGREIGATFNRSLDDNDDCLTGTNWFYAEGPEAGPVGTIDFFSTVQHEIGHGLGVTTFGNLSSGAPFLGMTDIYMRFLEDHSTGKTWNTMSNAERATSATDTDDLHWIGPAVQAASGILDAGTDSGHVKMYSPDPLRSGSSVAHFDVSLEASGFDELMEPFSTGLQDVVLSDELLEDLGWGTVAGGLLCGNGTLDGVEQCDDGDPDSGDGCSSGCTVEPCHTCDGAEPTNCSAETGTACDDGDQCTSDLCQAGVCVGTPLDGTACDDGQECTTDLCAAGVCVGTPENGTSCDDGFSCTTDTCVAGVCTGDIATCELDHFKMYKAKSRKGFIKFAGAQVSLVDQFETKDTDAIKPFYLGNPVDKESEGIRVPEAHLECYKIKDTKTVPKQVKFAQRTVQTTNQFGTETLTVVKPITLCVPSAKDEDSQPPALAVTAVDHFKCYKAKTAKGTPKFQSREVSLADQFETKDTLVIKPAEVCNPVDKNGEGILNPTGHLECYKVKDVSGQIKFDKTAVFTTNQFGEEALEALKAQRLCVPSTKTDL